MLRYQLKPNVNQWRLVCIIKLLNLREHESAIGHVPKQKRLALAMMFLSIMKRDMYIMTKNTLINYLSCLNYLVTTGRLEPNVPA